MNTYITIDDMRFYAYHGVLEQEKKVGNNFSVSLRLQYPFEKAMLTDDLGETIDYSKVYEIVKKEMQQPSLLLENVAHRIIAALNSKYPLLKGGYIKVSKPNPPICGDMASVAIEVDW